MAMAPFSITTSSVALAPIGAALGGRLASLQWVVSAFALGFATTLLPFGSLADRRGRKRLFVAGTALFAVTSLATAAAPTMAVLLAIRAVQGAAGAMCTASGIAILTNEFREPAARKAAFGVLGSIVGLGLVLGAVAGGPLVDVVGWRVGLVAHVPLALVALRCAGPIVESRGPSGPADVPGALASAGMLGFAIAYGTIAPTQRWASAGSIALLVGAMTSGVAFFWLETSSAAPMIDLHMFRERAFAGASLLALSFTSIWVALFIFVPLYLQVAHERSASAAGLWLLLLLGPGAVAPLLAARLGRRCSPHMLLVTGSLLMSAGCFAAALLETGSLRGIAVGLVITGVGAGFVNGLMDYVAVSALPEERSGVAGGAFYAMRLVGDAIAGVVPGTILTLEVARRLDVSRARASAIVAGDTSEAGGGALDMLARDTYAAAMSALLAVLALGAFANAALSYFAFRPKA